MSSLFNVIHLIFGGTMEERVNAQQTRNERGQGLMRLAGMVYEAARHRQQDDRNKGTCWGDRGEMRGARERQGKHVEWVRIGTVPQGSVCRELSASLLLLSCHRNLILKSLLSITYVFYGQMLLELDRHQTDTNQRAALLQGFYVSAKSKLQILGVKVQCLQLHTKY